MTDGIFIMESIRRQFEAWNRKNYHNKTITGDEIAWAAWQAALLSDRQETLSELEPGDYMATNTKNWLRKEISALKKSIGTIS